MNDNDTQLLEQEPKIEPAEAQPTGVPPEPDRPDKPIRPSKPPKQKKRLTETQRWWRFHGMQAGLFAGMGMVGAAALILLICLVTLPFRGKLNRGDVQTESIAEQTESQLEAAVTPEPTPEPTPQVSTVSLMAVGDNLIHSTVYEYAQQDDGTYDFTALYQDIQSDLDAADIACIQQETILVSDPSLYSNYPCFGTPAEMADSLTEAGFDVVCHASNHTLDKATLGVEDSLAAWKKHPEVTVLGIHGSQEDADKIAVVEKNGIKIAMLNYTYGLNGFVPEEEYLVDLLDDAHQERIASQLEEASRLSDITVVFMHDGTEGQLTPDADQEKWAQFFADHGVGLIIGTHPHVVEPVELVTGESGNKMPVFYSLGNFVSSQKDTANMLGGMAKVTITKDQTGTYVSDYHIEPLVTLMQTGGTHGTGYRFRTMHLEDYTEELGQTHIRANCHKSDMDNLWATIFEDASTGMNDTKHPLSAGTPVSNTGGTDTTEATASPSPAPADSTAEDGTVTELSSPSPSAKAA